MGPRLVSRGNSSNHPKATINDSPLQWGRGLLAVEIKLNWTELEWVLQLQWGRGLLAAEISDSNGQLRTSPEILQWGRGLLAAEIRRLPFALVSVPPTSMGPRLVSRGNERLSKVRSTATGHFNGAAAC